jgi:hypothetical protein
MKLPLPNEIDARTRVILEKITAPLLAKNFPAFYGTPMFITFFTTALPLSLPCAKLIQST